MKMGKLNYKTKLIIYYKNYFFFLRCAQDKYLLQNLDYVSDLMVGKEAHVYKYADRSSIFFDCKITITIKEPEKNFCDVPNCPDLLRSRRSNFINEINKSNNNSNIILIK